MEKEVYGCISGWHFKDCAQRIFWKTIPILWADLLEAQNLLFTLSNNQILFPPNQEQPGKLDGALTFVPLRGSQTFLLQNAVWKRCKTKLLNCKKKKRREGGGRKRKKQKAPFPLLIEFKGITCSTLQQMGSYTNFKAIKRYKVPCGAGLHWS